MTEDKLERKDPRFRKIQITVDAYMQWIENEDGTGQGLTRFKAFPTDVYDDDDNRIGMIGGGTGAVTLSRSGMNEHEWTIHHDDLWYAFLKALEEEALETA